MYPFLSNLSDRPPQTFKHKIAIPSPFSGVVRTFSQFNDISTQNRVWGVGLCAQISGAVIYSPISAEVLALPALGYEALLKAKNGLCIRIKIGPNTHALLGERCKRLVKEGQKVEAGTPIMEVDPYWMKQNNLDTHSIVTIPNGSKLKAIVPTNAKRLVAIEDPALHLYI